MMTLADLAISGSALCRVAAGALAQDFHIRPRVSRMLRQRDSRTVPRLSQKYKIFEVFEILKCRSSHQLYLISQWSSANHWATFENLWLRQTRTKGKIG
jgi:hypothetical protein